jgi:hypothetical protein
MIPDVVWGALAGLPLGILTAILGLRQSRLQAGLTQAQIDSQRIKDLMEEGRVQDARLDAANDKLYALREAQLKSESEKNDALAKSAACEDERQRITALALQQQKEIENLKKRRNTPNNYQDRVS